MLFGASTEETEQVLGEERAGAGTQEGPVSGSDDGAPACKKAAGHGHTAASVYSGAEHIYVPHAVQLLGRTRSQHGGSSRIWTAVTPGESCPTADQQGWERESLLSGLISRHIARFVHDAGFNTGNFRQGLCEDI